MTIGRLIALDNIHIDICMYVRKYMHTYVLTYIVCRMISFFEGENFHGFHESIAIYDNFTLEMLFIYH